MSYERSVEVWKAAVSTPQQKKMRKGMILAGQIGGTVGGALATRGRAVKQMVPAMVAGGVGGMLGGAVAPLPKTQAQRRSVRKALGPVTGPIRNELNKPENQKKIATRMHQVNHGVRTQLPKLKRRVGQYKTANMAGGGGA